MVFSTKPIEKADDGTRRAQQPAIASPPTVLAAGFPACSPLRDIRDVEARVAGAVDRLGPLPKRSVDELVLDGIGLAYRIERALPPGTALEPILQSMLDNRLLSRASNAAPGWIA